MIGCVRRAIKALNFQLCDVVIVGSVGRCLSGRCSCSNVGDLDVFLMGRAAEDLWSFIAELLSCPRDEREGYGFQPVYCVLKLPEQIRSWEPCQEQFYAHPLALTINCERHRRHDKRVNLDIMISCDDVTRVPLSEHFLYLLNKEDVADSSKVSEQHEEFMRRNCKGADFKDRVKQTMRYSADVELYYVDDGDACRHSA